MSMTKLSLIACLSAATLSTAAWTVQHKDLRAAAAPAARPAPVTEIPTIAKVANARETPGTDRETVTVSGTHFSKNTSVRVVSPDGKEFTFGPNSLETQTTTQLKIAASFEAPGTYFLMVRNGEGTFSNAAKFTVRR